MAGQPPAAAPEPPDELAHTFNQPSGQCFPMPLDWQPTERLFELCQTRGISLEVMTPDQKGDLINEFRCYWNSQPDRRTSRQAVTAAVMNIADTDW